MALSLKTAGAWLMRHQRAAGGVLGRYRPVGTKRDVELVGVRLDNLREGDVSDDIALLDAEFEWGFERAELVYGTRRIVPQEGDSWTFTDELGRERRHVVYPRSESEDAFEPLDPHETIVRVYMKDRSGG